jgi:hypothetical protein
MHLDGNPVRLRERIMGLGPFSDITVMDLTHVLSGPYCTMYLAEMVVANARSMEAASPLGSASGCRNPHARRGKGGRNVLGAALAQAGCQAEYCSRRPVRLGTRPGQESRSRCRRGRPSMRRSRLRSASASRDRAAGRTRALRRAPRAVPRPVGEPTASGAAGRFSTPVGRRPRIEGASLIAYSDIEVSFALATRI